MNIELIGYILAGGIIAYSSYVTFLVTRAAEYERGKK
jgi:hypothetical protein